MPDTRMRVLCIVGHGRSGSTLLSTLLGEQERFFSIGEGLSLFHTETLALNVPCGCGKRIEECPFWGDLMPVADRDILEFATGWLRLRNLPRLVLASKLGCLKGDEWKQLLFAIGELYREVVSETACKVIVDSSKHPVYVYLLSLVPGVELYILHLVRDIRGVVSSVIRPKMYIKAGSPWRACLRWIVVNAQAEFLRWLRFPYTRIRYEDFVDKPGESLERIVRFVGEPASSAIVPSRRCVTLRYRQHILAGNPDKLIQGQALYIQHQRWQLSKRLNLGITLFTWPLMIRYGYSAFTLGG